MKLEKYLEYRKIFENNYKEQIKVGKHDLEFVNLYDLKNDISRFKKFIFIYSYDNNSLFTNTVSSIDTRKRFIIKNNKPAIKIKIDVTNVHLIDEWSERFEKVLEFYNKNINNKKYE